jgi:outer membrane protein insertion porin family
MKHLFLSFSSTIVVLAIAPVVAEPLTNRPPAPNSGGVRVAEKINVQLDKPVYEPISDTSEPKIVVVELIVKGVIGDLEDEIYRVIQTRPGQSVSRSQLQDDIDRIIKTGRFAKVQAVPQDTALGVRVTFVVEPNPVLKQVQLTGRKVIPEQIVEDAFRSQYGQPLDRKTFQTGIQTLNKWYQDNGYILAQVADSSNITPEGIATIEVAEGEVEAIQIQFLNREGDDKDPQGNSIKGSTRSFIITREMETRSGETVNRNRIQADLQRIAGLRIFKDVKVNFAPGSDPRKVIVVIQPIEQSNITATPGVNWSSRTGFSAIGGLQAGNIGGNNQKLNAEVELGDRTLAYDLSFTDPWIGGDRYRTGYTARVFRQLGTSLNFEGGKTDVKLANGDRPRILRTGAGITFNRSLSADVFKRSEWVASLGLQYQNIEIQDASRNGVSKDALGNDLSASGTGRDDFLSIPFVLTYDKRNDPLTPTQGSVLRLSSEQSIPIGQSSIFSNALRASYSTYVPANLLQLTPGCRKKDPSAIDCPQAFAFNLTGGTILGKLPPYQAFSLGGTNSVRGYEDGDVGSARSFVQASAEYRFPVFSLISGALFVDAATDFGSGRNVIGTPGEVRSKTGNGLGYGLGVRINSPLGPIRLDYGWNDRGENKLHFGLGERF